MVVQFRCGDYLSPNGNCQAFAALQQQMGAATRRSAISLKILVREDADGRAQISYNSPAYLRARHALPDDLVRNIAMVTPLATAAAE
jgi:hypothetical protein